MSFNDNADRFESAMEFADAEVSTKRLASNTVVVEISGRVTGQDDTELRMIAGMNDGDVERLEQAKWKVVF